MSHLRWAQRVVAASAGQDRTRILEAVDRDLAIRGGETTALLLAIARDGQRVVGASVGDSQAHLFAAQGSVELTAGQSRKPRLGSGSARVVAFDHPLPAEGWTILIASDGLFDYANPQEIASAASDPDIESCAERCARLPRLPGGGYPDDLSVLVIRPAISATESVSQEQSEVCRRFDVAPVSAGRHLKVGIAANVRDGNLPIHGLRLAPEPGTTGWFIWAGGEMSDHPDFFEPLHVSHLADRCPSIERYLALPRGWRFLVAGDYEDVWFDSSLVGPC